MSKPKPSCLAFEEFNEDSPQELWRVAWWSSPGKVVKKRLRCVNYFLTEKEAWDFAAGIILEDVICVQSFYLKAKES